MKKIEDNLFKILLILIIILSLILIYKIKRGPKYDQELFDEISSKYEELTYDQELLLDENVQNVTDKKELKKNPTYITVNAKGNAYKVIGKIKIEKIDIEYFIIAETTDENLKIAPTKVCGPLINTMGNLCIAGHNYLNNKLFSNLYKLKVNDIVTLIDNNNIEMNYKVYDKYVVSYDDVNCLNQDTNLETEVTLITCTDNKNERLIVKCRAVEDI